MVTSMAMHACAYTNGWTKKPQGSFGLLTVCAVCTFARIAKQDAIT
jgi:hypothetical protein